MASFLQIENISKSYGPKVLFEHIGFNVNEGDKIALIAPNGTGKTSLLRIISGKDKSDGGGRIMFMKDIRICFLEQEYAFDPEKDVFRQIMDDSSEWTAGLDGEGLDGYGHRVRALLDSFGITDPGRPMGSLSGGEVKRVALTRMLASEADFYIMDEPTNHLDIDAIEFLESCLKRSRRTLLMVTHDRYFLDNVCNTVMELDHGELHIYRGGYMNFLEKRQERIDNYDAETVKVRNILRREMEWMHSSPQARTGKSKSRKKAFYELKERAESERVSRSVDISDFKDGSNYLGNKIINCRNLSFFRGDACYLKDFTYNFQRYEKVGIVGGNGTGKTTFLNLITGVHPEGDGDVSGIIERGESLKIGYYRQDGIRFDEGQTVLETVNDTGLLGRFLFPHDMLNNKVERLSGGEKRRLYLLTILMRRPNLMILDEPTNDLDIVTLDILEEYLQEFSGTLIIVSHDRHFLDRLVDHLLIFCGNGVVKDFIGDYSGYREYMREQEAENRRRKKESKPAARTATARTAATTANAATASAENAVVRPARLSYKEKMELQELEKRIGELEAEKAELEAGLSGGTLDPEALMAASTRYGELCAELDAKETRWIELTL